MQIHEITKRLQRTDEGILDDLKAAVTATKTGYNQGGVKGALKNLGSRNAYNQALQQNQRAQTNKDINKLEKKWGTKIKRPLSYYADQLQNPTNPEFKPEAQKAQQQRQALEPQFTQTFVTNIDTPTDVLPDQGQVLSVELNKGRYFKTANGKWYNEIGQLIPQSSYAGLEKMIDQDQYKQEPIPFNLPGGQPADNDKKVKKVDKVQQVTPVAGKEPNAPELAEARNIAQTGSLAKRAAGRNAGVQPTQSVQQPNQAPQKKGRANLKTDFGAWIANKLGGDYKSMIDSSPEIKRQLTDIFAKMTTQKDPAVSKELFDKYVLTAQAALLKLKVEGGIEDQESDVTIDDQLAQLRGEPAKKTGNQKLDSLLTQAGIALSEGQVAISKDIRVKTPKGDYVKSAADQQWYDPNGVLISADKYADFIKKLDATPAARTAYQSAQVKGTGSDSAFIQAKVDAQVKAKLDAIAKETAQKALSEYPPAPPPQATAADWEQHKAEQNRINNQMLAKSVNDLRYAEWFNTGQQDYLKGQVAQLIGTKF